MSRQISIGHFRPQNLPSAVAIHEQRQRSSTVSRRTNRQYRISSDSARKNLEKTEPMKQISVGIIGSGFIAELHMHAYRRVFGLDARVRAVVSRGDRVVEFAKRFWHSANISRLSRTARRDKDIDVIDISAPRRRCTPR